MNFYENKPQTEKARDKDEIKSGSHIVAFCEYCEDFVDAKVVESKSDIYDFGRVVSFKKLDLFCTRCGRYVHDDEIEDINDKRQSIVE